MLGDQQPDVFFRFMRVHACPGGSSSGGAEAVRRQEARHSGNCNQRPESKLGRRIAPVVSVEVSRYAASAHSASVCSIMVWVGLACLFGG